MVTAVEHSPFQHFNTYKRLSQKKPKALKTKEVENRSPLGWKLGQFERKADFSDFAF